jgi:hypothetical protein
MEDIFEDLFDEQAAVANINTETGRTLSDLVRKLRNVEQEIEDTDTKESEEREA